MNKASGKLAAGVRKVKTEQKAPAPATRAATPPAAPKRASAAPRVAAAALHPDRIWPD
jgi:hypothetical protein